MSIYGLGGYYPMYNFHGGIQEAAYKEDIYSKKPTHLKTPNIETLDVSKTSKEKTDSAVKVGAAIVLTALAAYGLYKGKKYFKDISLKGTQKPAAPVTKAPETPVAPKVQTTKTQVEPPKPQTPTVQQKQQAPAEPPKAQAPEKTSLEKLQAELKDKYKKLTDDQVKAKYQEAFDPTKKMDVEEYKILKKEMARRFEIDAPNFKGSAVEMHHEIHGANCHIRSDIAENGKPVVMKKIVDKMDADFSNLTPTNEAFTVYRGRSKHPVANSLNTDFNIIENAKIGDIITPDTGYPYAAFHRKLAECWGGTGANCGKGTMMMEIRVPKGAKLSCNLEHGGEAIFPRSSQFKLISKGKDPEGIMNVVLEYILPQAK
ncbi:MAG: hypothetical protein KH321_02585 [Clostridium sp.]|nr:hypothetical protein [Clostridium sp.]